MNNQTLQDVAIKKALKLSEEDALKVLTFMTELDSGSKLASTEQTLKEGKKR